MMARGMPPADLVELGRVPLTQAEALRLAAAPWKNPAARNSKKIEWQSWAQAKYRRLSRPAPGGQSSAQDKPAAHRTP